MTGRFPKVFQWCSEREAEGCYLGEPHAHVAISSPNGRKIQPKCGVKTLHQFFYDLDPDTIRRNHPIDPEKTQELLDHCFTEAHAKELLGFVEPLEGLIVVNCEAGVSRSPAVVLAFRRKYGGDTEECFHQACPNIHVASVLGRILENRA